MHRDRTVTRTMLRALGTAALFGMAGVVLAGKPQVVEEAMSAESAGRAGSASFSATFAGALPSAATVESNLLAVADVDLAGMDSLFGRSGKLQARFVTPSRSLAIPVLQRLFGDSAQRKPGVYVANDSALDRPFSLVTLLPFSAKQGSRIGSYRIGFWPYEKRKPISAAYRNPAGFILHPGDQGEPGHPDLREFPPA
jgi:hypothetical protein